MMGRVHSHEASGFASSEVSSGEVVHGISDDGDLMNLIENVFIGPAGAHTDGSHLTQVQSQEPMPMGVSTAQQTAQVTGLTNKRMDDQTANRLTL